MDNSEKVKITVPGAKAIFQEIYQSPKPNVKGTYLDFTTNGRTPQNFTLVQTIYKRISEISTKNVRVRKIQKKSNYSSVNIE